VTSPSSHEPAEPTTVWLLDARPVKRIHVEAVLDATLLGEIVGIEVLGVRRQLPSVNIANGTRDKIRWVYDSEADALAIHLSPGRSQVQRATRVTAIVDAEARLVAVEIPAPAAEQEIYVRLLDEDIDVWRPVQAAEVSDGVYRILDQHYNREIETWEFDIGATVVVELVELYGGPRLTAVRGVNQP
jgi:uncharacterized protein YuzE